MAIRENIANELMFRNACRGMLLMETSGMLLIKATQQQEFRDLVCGVINQGIQCK
jgi:hypothetical protein